MIERDYLERTIATVRNHRDADNCWPSWANIFADEIERLWQIRDALATAEPLGTPCPECGDFDCLVSLNSRMAFCVKCDAVLYAERPCVLDDLGGRGWQA